MQLIKDVECASKAQLGIKIPTSRDFYFLMKFHTKFCISLVQLLSIGIIVEWSTMVKMTEKILENPHETTRIYQPTSIHCEHQAIISVV